MWSLPDCSSHVASAGTWRRAIGKPAARRENIDKATGLLGALANDLGISVQQVRDQARRAVEVELAARGEQEPYRAALR